MNFVDLAFYDLVEKPIMIPTPPEMAPIWVLGKVSPRTFGRGKVGYGGSFIVRKQGFLKLEPYMSENVLDPMKELCLRFNWVEKQRLIKALVIGAALINYGMEYDLNHEGSIDESYIYSFTYVALDQSSWEEARPWKQELMPR